MPARPRVLVVDDTESVRMLIAMNLEIEGFDVRLAGDGQEALELVDEVRPDVITLDVMMPRLDGLTTARRLKSSPSTAAIPIVMVTAAAQDSDRKRGIEAGVDAYLTKPFEPDELVGTVKALLPRR
jgi:DNA-binding response OmpR family regulator